MSDLADVHERYIPHSSLDAAVIRAVQATPFRRFLLIDPLFFAYATKGTTKAGPDINRHRMSYSRRTADAYTADESHFR